jgi:hypothetical protein
MLKNILRILGINFLACSVNAEDSKIVSIGDISVLEIPKSLAYADAIEKIKKEAIGTGVTIDVNNFYTEKVRELHNFVSSITYRFIQRENTKALAYLIEDREFYYLTYYEVDYSGNVLFSWSDSTLEKKDKLKLDVEGLYRVNEVLGLYSQSIERLKP